MVLSIRRTYVVVALLALLLAIFGYVSLVKVEAQADEQAISLAVSPQILDLTANPGETIDNTFRLTNASRESVSIRVTPKNFRPVGEEGAVDITTDDTSFSIARWIDVTPENAVIEPGKTNDFSVSINVPDNVEPGSHYGSVVFSTIPPDQEGSVALVSQEIAPVILVKIAGDVSETAAIEEFKSSKGFYSDEKSVELLSRIRNTGTVHFKPSGIIRIENMFGNQVAEFSIDDRNVLPNTIRQYSNVWDSDGFKFGLYTATLTVVYGEANDISTSEITFFVFPYQVIVPIVVLVGLAIFLIVKFRVRLTKAWKALSGKDESK